MKKLTLLSGVAAVALLAWPLASVDAAPRGGGSAAARASVGSRGFSSSHFAGRPAFANRAAAARYYASGRWANGNWRNGNWHHHHGGRVFVGFYPYWDPWWDYGYGYPYGYGYGYGYYPYGYYDGDQYNNGGGGNIAADVQAQLAREGFYRGPIDGVVGARTRSAIRAYERANGLHVDGLIDQRLLHRMGLA